MVAEAAVEEAQHGVGHAAVDAVVLLLPLEAGGVVFPRRLQQVECVSTSVWYVTRIQWAASYLGLPLVVVVGFLCMQPAVPLACESQCCHLPSFASSLAAVPCRAQRRVGHCR